MIERACKVNYRDSWSFFYGNAEELTWRIQAAPMVITTWVLSPWDEGPGVKVFVQNRHISDFMEVEARNEGPEKLAWKVVGV